MLRLRANPKSTLHNTLTQTQDAKRDSAFNGKKKPRSAPRRHEDFRSWSHGRRHSGRSRRGRNDSRRRNDSRPRSRSPPRRNDRNRERGAGDKDFSLWGTRGEVVGLRSGFGFIRPKDGQVDGRDLYFHAMNVAKGISFNELHMGDQVEFQVGKDEHRNQSTALQVRLVGGGRRAKSCSRSRSRGRS